MVIQHLVVILGVFMRKSELISNFNTLISIKYFIGNKNKLINRRLEIF